jgi:hypothetical protein
VTILLLILAVVGLLMIGLALWLCWRSRRPEPPKAEPRHARRRDPHEPLHYDHGSPMERWLYGEDDNREGK